MSGNENIAFWQFFSPKWAKQKTLLHGNIVPKPCFPNWWANRKKLFSSHVSPAKAGTAE
jgi:hypothetical protein